MDNKEKDSLTRDQHGRPRSLDGKVNLMLDLMQGDPFDKDDNGIIGELRQIKRRVYDLENWKNKTVAWALGVSFGGGALVAFIIAIILNKK